MLPNAVSIVGTGNGSSLTHSHILRQDQECQCASNDHNECQMHRHFKHNRQDLCEEEHFEESKHQIDMDHVSASRFSLRKLTMYAGPGWLMSIAYLDPGNLESDLRTGAIAAYSLLWLLFWSHVLGFVFQLLSARLATVTGRHLAQLIRQHYTTQTSIVLWAFAQCAIIGADIMEIIGTAIAFHILFRLPLWGGVLITTVATFVFMMLQNWGMRKLETFFMLFILVITVCFWVGMMQSEPSFQRIMYGVLVPVVPRHSEIQAVGMLGAIVMPHNMFLHSGLVGARDLGPQPSVQKRREANFYFGVESGIALFLSFLVNLAIVVVFARAFYSPGGVDVTALPGLADVDVALRSTLGSAAQYMWAIGLLAAGQSSTMTGTMAGQYITDGFLGNVFQKEWYRVAITRGISLVPSMLVAIFAVDHFDRMGELLNVLQSICLPTVLIPILKFCASPSVMNEFTSSKTAQHICSLLVLLVVGLNVFLFVTQVTSVTAIVLISVLAVPYLAFLLWLAWLPIQDQKIANKRSHRWQCVPVHEGAAEQIPLQHRTDLDNQH